MPMLAKRSSESENGAVALKRKRKWPYIAGAVAAVALAAGLLGLWGGKDKTLTISPTDTSRLVYTDLQDSISATGTVESAKRMTVYSTVAYTVQEVHVEVGDRVEEGQLLCKLDDQNIQDQIETQQAGLDASTSASNASIASAKDNYEQFKSNLEKGLNSSIISAENAATNAYNAYVTAQDTYDRYLAGLNAGENTTLLAQESALRNARNAVESAYNGYDDAVEAVEDAEDALEELEDACRKARSASRQAENALEAYQEELSAMDAGIADLQAQQSTLQQQLSAAVEEAEKAELQSRLLEVQSQIAAQGAERLMLQLEGSQIENTYNTARGVYTQAQAALEQGEQAVELAEAQVESYADAIQTAEEAYETAQKQYNAALTSVDNLLEDYAKNVQTAFQAYETAKTSLAAAETAAKNQLQTYKNNLNSAYASANKTTTEVSLRQLQADLASTEITAPMSGTVTAVYAEVGSAGSGLLFVIEDTENFVITTSVKDYDIAAVEVGTPATIRSDATGEDLYEGEITYIAPTANKTALGTTDTSGDISFAADVKVNSTDTRLRIGLSVRLNFIVAEEKGVLAAPYDAIYTNSHGQDCVLVAEEQADGFWLLREMPVETGLETDLDIAVKGNDLTGGMTVVSNPEQYVSYIGQYIRIGSGGESKSIFEMQQEMLGGS